MGQLMRTQWEMEIAFHNIESLENPGRVEQFRVIAHQLWDKYFSLVEEL